MSRRRRAGCISLVLLAALATTGCKEEAPSAAAVRAHIEREVPGARLRRDSNIRLGRFTLAVAKGVMRLVEPGDRETRRALSHIHRVHVTTYEVLSLPDIDGLELPVSFERGLARQGWIPMLQEREEDSRTWVFLRQDEAGTIRNLYLVELDNAELTVIDLAGRLDRVMAEFVADDPDGFLSDLGS
jgi:hypothetical protein